MSESVKWPSINFADLDLAKPVTTLIEKCASGAAVIYEPVAIRKKAQAEADAKIIAARANLELSALEDRALERSIKQEARKQQNYENIIEKTLPLITDEAKPEGIDDDWLAYFFESCSTVSDEKMQSLWARLLAGEVEKTGSFSKRTVDFISKMSFEEAALFNDLCQFGVFVDGNLLLFVRPYKDNKLFETSINYSALMSLEAIGLVSLCIGANYVWTDISNPMEVRYQEEKFEYRNPYASDIGELHTGRVEFTPIAEELFKLSSPPKNNKYFQWVKDNFQQHGLFEPEAVSKKEATEKS